MSSSSIFSSTPTAPSHSSFLTHVPSPTLTLSLIHLFPLTSTFLSHLSLPSCPIVSHLTPSPHSSLMQPSSSHTFSSNTPPNPLPLPPLSKHIYTHLTFTLFTRHISHLTHISPCPLSPLHLSDSHLHTSPLTSPLSSSSPHLPFFTSPPYISPSPTKHCLIIPHHTMSPRSCLSSPCPSTLCSPTPSFTAHLHFTHSPLVHLLISLLHPSSLHSTAHRPLGSNPPLMLTPSSVSLPPTSLFFLH